MTDNLRRNTVYGVRNALQRMNPLPIIGRRNPVAGDTGFSIGQPWINQLTNAYYVLTSIASGAANWELLGSSGSTPITSFVVDVNGSSDYATVQAGLDAANAAGNDAVVYVKPGTYTENLTLYDGIAIQGAGLDTIITGVHTPPAAGFVTFTDLQVTSATDIFNSAAAGTTQLLLFNVLVNCTNGFTFNLLNWTGELQVINCAEASTNNGVVSNTGGATVTFSDSSVGAGVGQTLAITDGTLTCFNARVVCPISIAGNHTLVALKGCSFGGSLTTAGSSKVSIVNSYIDTGAITAITHGSTGVFDLINVGIDTSNATAIAGAGAGVMTLGSVTFFDSNVIAGTITLSNFTRTITGGLLISEGTNATSGATSLVAGTVTINTTSVRANSRIHVFPQGVLAGVLYISARVAGTSFTITSTNGADTPIVAWLIINPAL
jgi:hypothetical protein